MPDEHSFQKEVKEKITQYRGSVKSLAGSVFMAGMPDLLIVSRFGEISLIENKFWAKSKPPETFHELHKQFTATQNVVIKHDYWKRNVSCLQMTQLCYDLDTAVLCYKDKFIYVPWIEVAIKSTELPYGTSLVSQYFK